MVETIYTCDRCGKKFIPRTKDEKYVLYGPNEQSATKSSKRKVDLCENCNEALRDFMEDR